MLGDMLKSGTAVMGVIMSNKLAGQHVEGFYPVHIHTLEVHVNIETLGFNSG